MLTRRGWGAILNFVAAEHTKATAESKKRFQKKLKKLLTKRNAYDNMIKLSPRDDNKRKRKFSRLNEVQWIE